MMLHNSLKQVLATILLVLYFGIIAATIIPYFNLKKFYIQTDVVSFLTGARIVRDGRSDFIYDTKVQTYYQNVVVSPEIKSLLPFRNLPFVSVAYIPFLNYKLSTSFILILIINTTLLFSFHFLFQRFIMRKKEFSYLFLLPLLFYPSILCLIVGQYNPLILLCILGSYILTTRQKPFWAGLLISVLTIKPQLLLVLPFFISAFKNKRLYLFGLLIGLVTIVFANLLITKSISPYVNYPKFILETESPSYGSRLGQMYTLFALVRQYFPETELSMLLTVNFVLYILITFLILLKLRTDKNIKLYYLSGIIITLLFSIHALPHDLTILLVLIYIFFFEEKKMNIKIALVSFFTIGVMIFLQLRTIFLFLITLTLIWSLYNKYSVTPKHHKNQLKGN